jgi:hypothetical protein
MKKEVSTKKLLEALLHSYIETNDLGNIYNGDGTKLITLEEATSFIDGLKGDANPEQVAFESSFDTMMEEFTLYFPYSGRKGTPFHKMYKIWNKQVKPDLSSRYNNL